MKNNRTKNGICEIHKSVLEEKDNKKVHWDNIEKIWICEACDRNVVFKLMGIINIKISKKKHQI